MQRNRAVLQRPQRNLPLHLVDVQTGRVTLHEESLDGAILHIPGKNHDQVGKGSVADPGLLAIQHPIPPVAPGRRGDPGGSVGTNARFRHRPRPHHLEALQRPQPAPALGFAAKLGHGGQAKTKMYAKKGGHAGVDATLFKGNEPHQEWVRMWKRRQFTAEDLRHPAAIARNSVLGKLGPFPELIGQRPDFRLHEVARDIDHAPVFGRKGCMQSEEINHGSSPFTKQIRSAGIGGPAHCKRRPVHPSYGNSATLPIRNNAVIPGNRSGPTLRRTLAQTVRCATLFESVSIPVLLNEVKHRSGQAAGGSFTSFRMTAGRGLGERGKWRDHMGSTPIVHHCHAERSEASLWVSGRRILHFVQDDSWAGIGWTAKVAATARGCPPIVHHCHAERSEASLWAGGRKILHCVQDDSWAGIGWTTKVAATARGCPPIVHHCHAERSEASRSEASLWAGGRKILHFVQDGSWAGIGWAREAGRLYGTVPACPSVLPC
jgi:hypothetical protein